MIFIFECHSVVVQKVLGYFANYFAYQRCLVNLTLQRRTMIHTCFHGCMGRTDTLVIFGLFSQYHNFAGNANAFFYSEISITTKSQ